MLMQFATVEHRKQRLISHHTVSGTGIGIGIGIEVKIEIGTDIAIKNPPPVSS